MAVKTLEEFVVEMRQKRLHVCTPGACRPAVGFHTGSGHYSKLEDVLASPEEEAKILSEAKKAFEAQ